MRITPTFREKLALILAGEPTDTRRQTRHVEDRRGKPLPHEDLAAIIKQLKGPKVRRPNFDAKPEHVRAMRDAISRTSRKAWE